MAFSYCIEMQQNWILVTNYVKQNRVLKFTIYHEYNIFHLQIAAKALLHSAV